jgi:uncharacterized OB-fold protein
VTDAPFRVQPVLDDTNRWFWTSGEDGRLRFLRCQGCGYWLHPPLPRCPRCGGRDLAPEAISGRAELYTYTVNHQSWDGSTEPYAIALVTFPELGQDELRLTTNVVGCPLDELRIGMPLQVAFERHDLVFFPLFQPAVEPAEAEA